MNHHHKLLILTFLANAAVVFGLVFLDNPSTLFNGSRQSAQAISSAGVYVVSKSGTGNFTTIQACAEVVKAGETCKVEAGKYDELVVPVVSGQSGRPVTFLANGKVKVRGFRLDAKNYIKVQGFEITSLGLSTDVFPGIFLEGSNYMTIIGNTIHDTVSECIGMRNQFAANLSSHNVIKGNTIFNCGLSRPTGPAPGIVVFGHNNVIEGNNLSYLAGSFIKITGGDRNVVRNNILHDNSVVEGSRLTVNAIQAECSPTAPVAIQYLLVDGNTQSNMPGLETHFFDYSGSGSCGSGNFIIRNNLINKVGGTPVLNNKDSKKISFYENSFPNPIAYVSPGAQDGRLTKVAMIDSGRDDVLIVEDATPFQDGWANVAPDYISVGTKDNIVKVASINYSGNVITLAGSVTRSSGDPVWYHKSNGQPVVVKKTPAVKTYSNDTSAPTAPSDLKTNLVLVDEVGLTWPNSSDDVGVSGYKIFRDGEEIGSVKVAPFKDITVEQNTIYTYNVIATDVAGNESASSPMLQITTPKSNKNDPTPPRRAKAPEPEPVISIPIPLPSVEVPVIQKPVFTPPPKPKVTVTPVKTPTPTPTPELPPPVVEPSPEPQPIETPIETPPVEEPAFEYEDHSSGSTFKQMFNNYVDGFSNRFDKAVKIFGL